MGSNYCKSTVKVKPNKPITSKQFKQICDKYSKTYLKRKDAKKFLKDIASAVGVDYSKQLAKELLDLVDTGTGYLTTKSFHVLFFSSTDRWNIALTTSLKDKKEEILKIPNAPPPPAKKIKKKNWVLVQSQAPSWIYDPKTAKSANIYTIDWTEAVGFSRSEKGSTGVFFVGFPNNEVVVLKGSSTVLADMFASFIGNWSNIPVAKMVSITFPKDPQFQQIVQQLDLIDKFKPERLQGFHNVMCQIPILSLIEYIPGTEFSHADFKTLLNTDTEEGCNRCKEIGKIISLDVFINNWDRFPIIWDAEEGNLDNIFFTQSSIIGIDQSVTSILKTHKDDYFLRVSELLDQIAKFNPQKEDQFPLIIKFRDFILNHHDFHFDIGSNGTRNLWYGLMEGFISIIENVNQSKLLDLYQTFEEQVESVFEGMVTGKDKIGRYGLGRVNIPFLVSVLNIILKYKDIFQQRLDENNTTNHKLELIN